MIPLPDQTYEVFGTHSSSWRLHELLDQRVKEGELIHTESHNGVKGSFFQLVEEK